MVYQDINIGDFCDYFFQEKQKRADFLRRGTLVPKYIDSCGGWCGQPPHPLNQPLP
jgi:hypothetical protein